MKPFAPDISYEDFTLRVQFVVVLEQNQEHACHVSSQNQGESQRNNNFAHDD
jgi:hypothetical protein